MAIDTIIVQYEADTKELKSDIKGVNKAQESVAKTNDQVNKKVKKNNKSLTKSFTALGGVIAGAFAVDAIIGGLTKVVQKTANFEKALSSLSSITGATGKDLEFYKEQAIAIGSSTTLSASQAVEAFKLIGSAQPELLKNKEALAAVTKEAITLAEAAEIDLPVAAQSLAGSLNAFALPAEEAGRLINVLAAGSKEGAAAIPEISASLDQFGTAAAAMNVTIEESTGLIETLAENNLKGAEAGTALRNILLKVNTASALPQEAIDQLRAFGVDLDKVQDNSLSLNERLTEFSKISNSATALTKVFGTENFVAGQIILNNVDKVNKYTQAVTGTQTAIEQAAINTDNLSSDFLAFQSAIEGVILGEGGGLNEFLRGVVQEFTDIIQNSGPVIEVFEETGELIGEFVNEVVALLTELGILDEQTDQTAGFMGAFAKVLEFGQIGIRLFVKALTFVVQGIRSVSDVIKPAIDFIKEMTTTTANFVNNILAPLGIGFDEIKEKQEAVTESTQKQTEAVKEQTDEISKQQKEELRQAKLREKLAKQEEARQKSSAAKLKSEADKRRAAELKAERKFQEEKLRFQDKIAQLAINAIADETDRRIAGLNFRLEKELTTLQQSFDKELLTQAEFLQAKKDLETANEREIEAILAAQAEEIKAQKDEKKKEQDEKDLEAARRKEEALLEIQRQGAQLAVNLFTLILGKRAKASKALALFEIAVNQGVAISELVKDVQKVGLTPFEKTAIFLSGLAQITAGIIQAKNILGSEQEPQGFAKGVIDLQGGVRGKDSIPANLMPGESVMTEAETKKYKEHLQAMRSGNYEELLAKTYLNPLFNQISAKRKRHDDSFAQNLASTLGFNFNDTGMIHEMSKGNHQSRQNTDKIVDAIKGSNRDNWLRRKRSW